LLAAVAAAALAWAPVALAVDLTTDDLDVPDGWGTGTAATDHVLSGATDLLESGISINDGTIAYKFGAGSPEKTGVIITVDDDYAKNSSIVAGWQYTVYDSDDVYKNEITFSGTKSLEVGGSAYAGLSYYGSDYVISGTGAVTVRDNSMKFASSATIGGKAGAGAALWGDVTDNKVTVELAADGSIDVASAISTGKDGGIWAGIALKGGNVKNNSVEIIGDKKTTLETDYLVGGGTGGAGTTSGYQITGNSVKIEGSDDSVPWSIKVTNNIAGAVVNSQASPSGTTHTIEKNTVGIYSDGVEVSGNIYGAHGGHGSGTLNGATFKENIVKAEANVSVVNRIAGAYYEGSTGGNSFTGNIVDIAGSVTGSGWSPNINIYGAYGVSGTATDNYVKLTVKAVNGVAVKESDLQGDVAGAWLSGEATGDFSKNRVLLDGLSDGSAEALKIGGDVYGGYIGGESGTAKGNYVHLTGNVQLNRVYGTYTEGGDAGGDGVSDGNKVIIGILPDGTEKPFTGTLSVVYGAHVNRRTTSGDSKAIGNSVEIIGSELRNSSSAMVSVQGGYVMGTFSTPSPLDKGTASHNSVAVRAGSMTGDVTGGLVLLTAKSATATNNSVIITDSTAGELNGGYIIHGASTPLEATANDNVVEVENSTVGKTTGGYVNVRDPSGVGAAIAGSASGNTLKFTGATLKGSIYGGYIEGTPSSTAVATGNTVTFVGATNLDASTVDVAGGFTPGAGDRWTGNTLVLDRFTHPDGNSFKSISGFSALKFMIPGTFDLAGGNPVVNTDALDLRTGSSGNASVTYIDKEGGGYLAEGDEIILIQSKTPIDVNGDFDHEPVTGWGLSTVYVFQVEVDKSANALKATLASESPNEQAKAISELTLADVSFVNLGAEVLANEAIKSASASALKAGGIGPFAAVSFSKYRVETGSHIDVKGINGNIGVAMSGETSAGIGTVGLFLEFGRGEFDSYNDFQGLPSVHGSGNVTYIGGGILGRMEFGSADVSRPYVEGSVRLGRTSTDFNTDDFLANFDGGLELHSGYYGFHFGLGYVFSLPTLGNDSSLDLSAKLFHTRREGGDFIAMGERIAVSAVTSTKLIVGGRLNIGVSEIIRPFVGAYYEREFKGDSRVTVGRFSLPAASLKGDTGIGELGVTFSPSSVPVKVELGIQGSCGKRDGISVSLLLNYTF
jgi:hypothetical protein